MEDLSKLDLRIPQFIEEDYPQFAKFVRAYYKWLSLDSSPLGKGRAIHTWKDIDESVDEFTDYYANQYIEEFPRDMVASKKRVIKQAKEFYRSKGSEKSVAGLFGILYGENPSLLFPKDMVFRSSAAKWQSVETIKITTNNSRLQEIVGKEIVGQTSKARAFVDSYVLAYFGTDLFAELTLTDITGEFSVGENVRVTLDDAFIVQESVLPVISSVTISNPGLLYSVGDLVNVTGGDGSGLSCKVAEISRGNFYTASIVNPGQDYQIGDLFTAFNGGGTGATVKVTSINVGTGAITGVTLVNAGSGYTSIPSTWISDSEFGIDAEISVSTNNIGKIKKISFDNFGVGYTTLPTLDMTGHGNGLAVLTPLIGAHSRYTGSYFNYENILGEKDYITIQDGYYYQDFSYVIRSGVSIDSYREVLKKLVHPAGMIVFGEVSIDEKVKVSLFQGVPGRIDENLGRMFRCVVKHHYNKVISEKSLSDKDILIVSEDKRESLTTMNKEMDRWMKWRFTSRNISHVANLRIKDYSMQADINTDNYNQNMNIQMDCEVDYLLVDYLHTENSDNLNTENLDRFRT